jgi:peptide/nickel transport system substrate-binding protein
MSPSTVTPLGAMAPGNWHRYGSAAAEPLLTAFERAREPVEQERLIRELSAVFSAEAPAIPLYPNPSWAEFNTRRVDGFPDAAHPYADPSPNKEDRGETLRVLTELVPR